MTTALPPKRDCLGPTLRRWRVINRVKQAALAEELGVSQATVSRWESGALAPDRHESRRLTRLLTARPSSSADRALLDLVRLSSEPVHLICDLTHRLLAASPSRCRTWRVACEDLQGTSLWRFASEGIDDGEASLGDRGWYDELAPELAIGTERAEFAELTIRAGTIRYTRLALSDGRFARLVRDGRRSGPA